MWPHAAFTDHTKIAVVTFFGALDRVWGVRYGHTVGQGAID